MSVHHRRAHLGRAFTALAGGLALAACSTSAAAPGADLAPPPTVEVDPPSAPGTGPSDDVGAGPHEVNLVADLGPLPDGSGRAVVTTTWTTDAAGTVRFAIDTPAGLAAQHVLTEDEHWWWLHPEARAVVADAEWVHFDLPVIESVGGELPDLVAEARLPPPRPDGWSVGEVVAGREVLQVEVVDADEVHLTVAGVERPVVHRLRPLPASTRIDLPTGAVDVADLPDVLRW